MTRPYPFIMALFSISLLAGCALPWAGPRFTPSGLTGRVVLALLAGDGSTVLAGTDDGIYRSTDAGRTWQAAGGLEPETTVPGLSRASDALYAATGRGAYRSDDAGATWRPLGDGLPRDEPLLCILADPGTPRRLVVGASRHGLFRSDDGGATWTPVSTGLPRDLAVYALAADPGRPGRLLAGTIGAGLFRSDDGGMTWQTAGSGLPPVVHVFAIAGAGGGLALGTSGGFFRSDDGGQTWRWSKTALGHTRVVALASDPVDARRLVAGADDGVYQSRDGGQTWQRLGEGLPDGEHIGAVAIVGRRVLAGAGPVWALDQP